MAADTKQFTERELDRIIEMAWEDRTPFEALLFQFGLPEKEVIKIMRGILKESSFKRWRKRVNRFDKKRSKRLGHSFMNLEKVKNARPISGN